MIQHRLINDKEHLQTYRQGGTQNRAYKVLI